MTSGAASNETTPAAASIAHNSPSSSAIITPTSLRSTLTERLAAEYVEVDDISEGCGQSFEATIVSSLFEKKRTLARHRLVNAALKIEIAAIHAWTPRCFTPEEWKRRKQEEQGNLGS